MKKPEARPDREHDRHDDRRDGLGAAAVRRKARAAAVRAVARRAGPLAAEQTRQATVDVAPQLLEIRRTVATAGTSVIGPVRIDESFTRVEGSLHRGSEKGSWDGRRDVDDLSAERSIEARRRKTPSGRARGKRRGGRRPAADSTRSGPRFPPAGRRSADLGDRRPRPSGPARRGSKAPPRRGRRATTAGLPRFFRKAKRGGCYHARPRSTDGARSTASILLNTTICGMPAAPISASTSST